MRKYFCRRFNSNVRGKFIIFKENIKKIVFLTFLDFLLVSIKNFFKL